MPHCCQRLGGCIAHLPERDNITRNFLRKRKKSLYWVDIGIENLKMLHGNHVRRWPLPLTPPLTLRRRFQSTARVDGVMADAAPMTGSIKIKWGVLSEAMQGKASAVADKRIAKPLSQGFLTQGLVVE
jgi:hypothetical protein